MLHEKQGRRKLFHIGEFNNIGGGGLNPEFDLKLFYGFYDVSNFSLQNVILLPLLLKKR